MYTSYVYLLYIPLMYTSYIHIPLMYDPFYAPTRVKPWRQVTYSLSMATQTEHRLGACSLALPTRHSLVTYASLLIVTIDLLGDPPL